MTGLAPGLGAERAQRGSAGRWLWLALFTLLLGACSVDAVSPRPESIDPEWVFNGVDTPVRVVGSGFRPALEVDARGGGRSAGDGGHAILLRREGAPSVSLIGVVQHDRSTLGAVVPAGVEPGVWDVVVRSAFGREGVLTESLVVSDTRAAMLAVDADALVYTIFDEATVRVRVVDPAGDPVANALEVRVELIGEGPGEVDANLIDVGLADPEPLEDRVGARGRLDEAGEATVRFTLRAPDTITLRVSAVARDAGVTAAEVRLLWRPGGSLRSRIRLPSPDLRLSAGESFTATVQLIDQFGTAIDGAGEVIVLRDACASWAEAVVLDGETPVQVVPRRATSTPECPENWVEVLSGPTGRSDVFQVEPGPIQALNVAVSPLEVVAGEVLDAFITPVDAYGNRAQWAGSIDALQDTLGGVQEANCTQGIPRYCAVRSVVAGDSLRLDVIDSAGITGRSGAYRVRAAEPASVRVATTATTWTAGQDTPVQVSLRDAFGNIATASTPIPSVTVIDPLGEAVCDPDPASGPLDQRCALFTASASTHLIASVEGVGVSPASAVFAVRNSSLDALMLTPASDVMTAGGGLTVQVAGLDAWGNRWSVQEPLSLTLRAGATTLPLSLDGEGLGAAEVQSERAGTLTLQGQADGAPRGPPATVSVVAAPAAILSVETIEPWAQVGEPVRVLVEALDTYGNRDTALPSTSVTLSSESGLANSTEIVLSHGFASGTLAWTSADTNARVRAVGGGLEGVSEAFLSFLDCDDAGPAPMLRFGTHAEGIVCALSALNPVAGWSATLQGSTASDGASLLAWGLQVEGSGAQIALTPGFQGNVTGIGRHDVLGLVMQSDGCGAVVASSLWAGLDNGSPVGPVALSVDRDEISLGDPGTEAVVEIAGVVDCRRQPAAGASLRVRATRGDLRDLTPTGSGLQVTLDAFGEGVFRWSAADRRGAGLGHLLTWAPGGAARGTAEATFAGDLVPPTVWDQSPRGALESPAARVTLTLSEAIDEDTVFDAFPRLVQSGQPDQPLDPELSSDGRTLDLWLPAPLSPGGGLWWVRLDDEVRDLHGNRLDGDWDGAPGGAYLGGLGGNATAPSAPSCGLDLPRFRPDGDDGPGEDADGVVLSFEAGTTPARWVVTVLEPEGTRLRRDRIPASGAAGQWLWDGRDATERVLPNGSYTLAVAAEGVDSSRSAPCVRSVEIQNQGG